MKKSFLFLIVIFLITSVSSLQQLSAQDKTQEEKEKEMQIQKTINDQKRAMADQKKAQAEALENLQRAQEELDKSIKDINVEVEVDADEMGDQDVRTHLKRIDRSFRFEEPYVFTPGVEPFYFHGLDGDNESTSWEFSRKVKEKTLKSEYTFDVEKTANSVVMSVMGDCKAGEIRVKIVMPGGKTYSDIVIDEFGNLNWRKSFTISDTENQDKAGAWKFVISSSKATGYFKISLQAY
jgi:type II secretory pathway pseudopilin PulG